MVQFELYIDGEFFQGFKPASQAEFLYDNNLTAYENRKQFRDRVDVSVDYIKKKCADKIEEAKIGYQIILVYQPVEIFK